MLEVLLYSSLTCQQTQELIHGIERHRKLSEEIKTELVETVKESKLDCEWLRNWDAHD